MPAPNVWPFFIEAGSSESVEYFTNVLTTFGKEQRIRLRQFPRVMFKYVHFMEQDEAALATAIIRDSAFTGDFHVPVWSELEKIEGEVLSSDTVLSFDTTNGSYNSGFVFVWENNNSWVLAEIASVTSGSITLTEAIGTSLSSPLVMPVRRCFMSGPAETSVISSNARFSVSFTARDSFEVDADSIPTFSDYPVYPFDNFNVRNTLQTISRVVEYFDNGFGLVQVEPYRDDIYPSTNVTMSYNGIEEKTAIRKFISLMGGKQKPFFLPTFRTDLIPLTDSTTQIIIKSGYPTSTLVGRAIRIEQKSGAVLYNRISGVSGSTLTLSQTSPQTVGPTLTKSISLMDLYRGQSDTFEFPLNMYGNGYVSFTAEEITE